MSMNFLVSRRRCAGAISRAPGLRRPALRFLAWLLPLAAAPLFAGTLVGTVINKNTRGFLDRAAVQVPGYQTLTDKLGQFRIAGLPAGTYLVTADYTDLEQASRTVMIGADETVSLEFELTSGQIYKLDQFVVTGAVEGAAYAINQQRRAETARTVTSIDAFLDQTTGNPGEFLKSVEGIQMDYSNNEPQSIRVRGIDPNLTNVTMDGNEIASAASSGANRNVQIDQLSIANIESVEVYKANIPSMSANAIGGAVNFTTKSAFNQKGRKMFLQAGVKMDSNDFHFRKSPGPGDGDVAERRVYPVFRFEYLNSFFGNRAGVAFSIGHELTDFLGSSAAQSLGTPTAKPGGTLPPIPALYTFDTVSVQRSSVNFAPNRQRRKRDDISLNLDYKVGDGIAAFLKTTLTNYKSTNRNHQLNLTPTAFTADSNIASYTATSATASQSISAFDKYTLSWQINPGLNYRRGDWKVELNGGFSRSINHYKNPNSFGALSTTLTGLSYSLTTPLDTIQPYALVQKGGPDIYDLNSYAPSQGNLVANGGEHRANDNGLVSNNKRDTVDTKYSGRLDVQRDFHTRYPFYVKGGLAYTENVFNKHQDQQRWYWMGDDGVASADDLTAAGAQLGRFPEPQPVTMGIPGWTLREPTYFSPNALYSYWRAHPQVLQENTAYALQQNIVGRQYVDEKVSAAYLMGVLTVNRWNFLAGVRVEKTEIKATGYRVLPTSGATSVLPPGVNPNSPAGIRASYRPQTTQSDYTSDPFPYVHVKYEWLPGLQTRVSYTEGIGRPNLGSLLPNTTQNDQAQTITSNRAGLLPQRSKNFDASVEYYTRSAGSWTATWFNRDIENFISTQTVQMTPALQAELNLGPEVATYQLITQQNIGRAKWNGFELGFRQALREWTWVPAPLRGVSLWANYTKIVTQEGDFGTISPVVPKITQLANTVPQLANGGISYRTPNGKLFVQVTQNYMAARPTVNLPAQTTASQTWSRRESYRFWNMEASYRLTDRLSLNWTGRNLGSERGRLTTMGVIVNMEQATGIEWMFSAKYDF